MGYFVAGGGLAASQQFVANQTDVFAVDASGQLTVSFVTGEGPWQGPLTIGPSGVAPAGCPVAASRQFGADQTDVFLVDNSGRLVVFWVSGGWAWNGPQTIGPAGIANPGSFVAASQQIGANQTDVFLIDKNGQLNVFWVTGTGAWAGPQKLGPVGLANPGTHLAVSQQFGATQTDVFVVDKNGQLNVFWVTGQGSWNGPEKIGPAGLAAPATALAASQQFGANQTDVFLIDKNGQLNVYWVTGVGGWNGPEKIGPTGLANPGTALAASQQFGANQTDVFVVGKNGQLNVFWVTGLGAWNGPEKIGPAGNANAATAVAASQQFSANQTDVFLIDKNGELDIFWVSGEGAWNGPEVRLDPVAAPGSGLGSNSNYILYDDCKPLIGVSVTIIVMEDLVATTASGPQTGFGFQFNAYSPKNELSAWQQYVVAIFGNQIVGAVDNWPVAGNNIINHWIGLGGTTNNTLLAKTVIRIALQNDAAGNITGATYTVIDPNGNTQANVSLPLTSISGVTSADLAPIVAFELNLVGPVNAESTVLTAGAGKFVYEASSVLTVLSAEPSCTESGYFTAETANSTYGVLSASSSTAFSQSFNVALGEAPANRRVGKARPPLRLPAGGMPQRTA